MHNEVMLIDCMDYMVTVPDKFFELAIVDPPYFEKGGDSKYYRPRKIGYEKKKLAGKAWKKPDAKYFKELTRISKKRIIWGCQYYCEYITDRGRIVFDKKK